LNKALLVFTTELVRQLKSWKVLVVVALMLALLISITASYSVSVQQTSFNQVQPMAVAINDTGFLGVRAYVVDGVGNPVSVHLTVEKDEMQQTPPYQSTPIAIFDLYTGSDGFGYVRTNLSYSELNPPSNGSFPSYEIMIVQRSGSSSSSSSLGGGFHFPENVSVETASVVSPSNSSIPGIVVWGMNQDGTPLSAQVYVGGVYRGDLSNGTFKGFYDVDSAEVEISYGSEANVSVGMVYRSQNYYSLPPADVLMMSVSQGFLSFFVPIAAIIAGYDALAREKVTGAIELVISRPVSKGKVYWGKTGGALAAMGVYFLAVSVVFYLFARYIGISLTLGDLALTFAGTLFLLFIFIFFESITGFFGRSTTAPILWGVLLWVFFSIVFGILTSLPLLLTGGAVNSAYGLAFENLISLCNPVRVATLIMGLSFFNSSSSFTSSTYGLTPTMVVASAVVWVVAVTALFVLVIKKKE